MYTIVTVCAIEQYYQCSCDLIARGVSTLHRAEDRSCHAGLESPAENAVGALDSEQVGV